MRLFRLPAVNNHIAVVATQVGLQPGTETLSDWDGLKSNLDPASGSLRW